MSALDDLYFIRCTVEDAGYSVLWWRADGDGYTDKLDEAGKYTADEVRIRTSRDTPVLVSVAESLAVRTVPASAMNRHPGVWHEEATP